MPVQGSGYSYFLTLHGKASLMRVLQLCRVKHTVVGIYQPEDSKLLRKRGRFDARSNMEFWGELEIDLMLFTRQVQPASTGF